MPDAFFSSTKKRKRAPSSSKGKGKAMKISKSSKPSTSQPKKKGKDEDLSSDNSEHEGINNDDDLRAEAIDPHLSGEEDAGETAGEKRLRLAKLYLEEVKKTLVEGEFDAADLDREIISSRLQNDALQHSGRVHVFVGEKLQGPGDTRLVTRGHRLSVTGAAISQNGRNLFTCSKDGQIIQWSLLTGKRIRTHHKHVPNRKGKGKQRVTGDEAEGHTDEIWALSVSSDGKFLATGGKDKRVGVWDIERGVWLKGFRGHKDSISGLAFRKGSNQLYSASHDRSVKLFDLSVMGYVETLFGHQDRISDIDALRGETAVTSGTRDKTVRFWKVTEESQIVFRGGTKSVLREVLEGALDAEVEEIEDIERKQTRHQFVEGCMECVSMIDEATFLSGGDSGTISLWSTSKKKPIFRYQLAHGIVEHRSDDGGTARNPRWITSLAALPYSDIFASGSWDGWIRLWRLDAKLRSFEPLENAIPILGVVNSLQLVQVPTSLLSETKWMMNKSAGKSGNPSTVTNGGPRPAGKDTKAVLLVAAIGHEPRTGRWLTVGEGAKNCGLVVPLEVSI
ncbi:pre-rRNA processing protein [Serendipita sp. 411]|nr:pre-rRNA processing protein [Serendipita sp. 401]KAG8830910.1 pre-rRNA processing protein [Serendipita sp. 400]KAG8853563.1 pre-rRNA processing protein [Serendipita sp. 411]KAG9054303.1 pre-rRNA processing protein [Serendipita sp. 407]